LKNAAHRIAHKNDIDLRLVQYPRQGIVISGETGNFRALLLSPDYFRYGNLVCHCALPKNKKAFRMKPEG
jgi:hypothetical protein